jgi:hypothetical protein
MQLPQTAEFLKQHSNRIYETEMENENVKIDNRGGIERTLFRSFPLSFPFITSKNICGLASTAYLRRR